MNLVAPLRLPLVITLVCGAISGALLSGGCSTPHPIAHDSITNPQLRMIVDSFEETISYAHHHPIEEWHAGAFGNMMVNGFSGDNYGLCYHWQELVWHGVIDTVREVGWAGTGVAINLDTSNEHHGVAVFDPRIVDEADILSPEHAFDVYVLDGWKRGRADVYHLRDWVEVPMFKRRPLVIEEMPPAHATIPLPR